MGKFDIYKHTVRLDTTSGDDQEYVLLPVGGDQIDRLLAVALKSSGKTDDNFMSNLDKDDLKNLRELVEATLVVSYPNENKENMKRFAQQNFTVFLEPVLSVNMGKAMNVAEDKALKGQ